MRNIFFTSLLSIITNITFAQYFQFFPVDSRAVYSINDSMNCYGGVCLKGYRVDTIFSQNGYIHNYTFRESGEVENLPGSCIVKTNLPSWLGEKVLYSSSGFNIIINDEFDSLFTYIHPFNGIGGSPWKFYDLGNGDYIQAMPEDQYFKQFVGRNDATKRVSLHALNAQGDSIPNPWNEKIIYYSHNFSIYNFPNVNHFPEDTNMYYIYGLQRYIPGTTASVDSFIPDAPDFFDYKRGQEWHYTINQRTTNEAMETVYTEIKRKKLLMNKEWNVDSSAISLTYWKVDVVWQETGNPPDENTPYNAFSDTIQTDIVLSDYDYLNRMPDEFYPTGHYGPGYVRWFAEGDWNGRIQKRLYEGWEYNEANHCLSPDPQKDGNIERIFIDQIGLAYEKIPGENQATDFFEKELVYYQLGLEEWGDALDFHPYFEFVSTNTPEILQQKLNVYPNPHSAHFNVEFSNDFVFPVQYQLIDLSGRLLKEGFEANQINHIQISTGQIPAGIYLLKIISDNDEIIRKRIVKM